MSRKYRNPNRSFDQESVLSQETVRAALQAQSASTASLRIGLILFLLGTLTAALYAFVVYPRQGMVEAVIDLNGFGDLGRHIAMGDGFGQGDGPSLRRAPLYPAFVAVLLRIFGSTGPDAQVYRPVIIAQCFMVGLSCVIAWTLGRKLFGERAGRLAGVLCAFTPQVVRYVGMTEVETTTGLLTVLLALTALNLSREPSVRNGIYFGLVGGALALVKAIALLYVPLFVLLMLRQWRRRAATGSHAAPSPLLPCLAAVATLLLCILPWCLRNLIVTQGQFGQISSNGPAEFLRGYLNAQPKFAFLKQDFGGNDPSRLQWDMECQQYEDQLLRQHGLAYFQDGVPGRTMRYGYRERLTYQLKKEKIEGAEMKRKIVREPVAFLRKFVIQLFTFWYIVETRKKSLLVGGIALVALALAAFGWTRARRNQIDVTPVISVVLYFNVIYAIFLAFARYSMPVYPTLLVLTAYGLTQLFPAKPLLRPAEQEE